MELIAVGEPLWRCAGCGEGVLAVDKIGESHARIEVETYAEFGHGCDGSEADCQRRCPVPKPAQRQVQVECGPVWRYEKEEFSDRG